MSIWNSRVNEALAQHNDLRVAVLVRNMGAREFVLFEDEAERYIAENYRWKLNNRDNFEGIEIATNARHFTWQPHGSQFTIHRTVPTAATKFRISPNVPVIEFEYILRLARYDDTWIEFQA